MAEKKKLKLWTLEIGINRSFIVEEVDATETAKQYQYTVGCGSWTRTGRINKAEMSDDVWVSEFDKYVGLSREAVIKRFISRHEYEVGKLKERIRYEENGIAAAKKLLEENANEMNSI